MLIDKGAAAQAYSCSNTRVLVTQIRTYRGVEEVKGLLDLYVVESQKVDSTQQFLVADQTKRFNQGLCQKKNLYIVNYALLVLLYLDIGRY